MTRYLQSVELINQTIINICDELSERTRSYQEFEKAVMKELSKQFTEAYRLHIEIQLDIHKTLCGKHNN